MSVFGRAEERVEADRRALAEQDARNRAAYAQAQTRRRVAARDAAESVKRARLDVQAAEDDFAAAAVARAAGTGSTERLTASWSALDRAQMELRAAEAVAADLAGPGLG